MIIRILIKLKRSVILQGEDAVKRVEAELKRRAEGCSIEKINVSFPQFVFDYLITTNDRSLVNKLIMDEMETVCVLGTKPLE